MRSSIACSMGGVRDRAHRDPGGRRSSRRRGPQMLPRWCCPTRRSTLDMWDRQMAALTPSPCDPLRPPRARRVADPAAALRHRDLGADVLAPPTCWASIVRTRRSVDGGQVGMWIAANAPHRVDRPSCSTSPRSIGPEAWARARRRCSRTAPAPSPTPWWPGGSRPRSPTGSRHWCARCATRSRARLPTATRRVLRRRRTDRPPPELAFDRSSDPRDRRRRRPRRPTRAGRADREPDPRRTTGRGRACRAPGERRALRRGERTHPATPAA